MNAHKKETRLRALQNQVHRLQQHLVRLRRISYRYTWIRLAIFLAGLLATGLALYFVDAWLAGICFVVGGALFGAAVYAHRQVRSSIRRHQVCLQNKVAQIARASLDWGRIPTTFSHRARPDHAFEADLDLVGRRSLHRLLDTAVSYEGSQRLRDWLTAPVPGRQQSVRRQQLVRELAPLHLFRDRLILNGMVAAGANKMWQASELVDWLKSPAPEASLRHWLLLSAALAGLNALLFAADRLGLLPPWWQVTFVLYLGLWLVKTRTLDGIWEEARALEGVLRQLRAVFGQLETFSYRDRPHLQALCAPFLDREHRPARYLARITRVVAAMSLRGNPLIRFVLNALVPWDLYFAYRLGCTRTDLALHAPRWMEAWFELEALSSLANFAYLNPAYTLPDLLDESQKPPLVLQAEGLGHPLIPDEEKICNDFAVAELGQVMIITGSNMAGKSVFLKTVGVNLALAYAGGPVNATSLQTVPFRTFSCMGIADSVTDGISYFYAEVKRLKRLLAELEREHPLPLLFCIDEIFRGTNNRERLIGSRAYVRALASRHGVGLIATHDLELARLADQLPRVENYHFRDHIAGGRMVFDYTLRPGPCPTTNALKIMELEGLPVGGNQR